jgi:hypothetical protein
MKRTVTSSQKEHTCNTCVSVLLVMSCFELGLRQVVTVINQMKGNQSNNSLQAGY